MSNEINYKNNPLNGVGLKNLLIEIVDHYGFEILYAYLKINCFNTNPSIDSSVKFLKKTNWAREKVEGFYMYEFKSMPRASAEQFLLPPRDRIVPDGQSPDEPAELSLEDGERLTEKRAKKWALRDSGAGYHSGSNNKFATQKDSYSNNREESRLWEVDAESSASQDEPVVSGADPWGKWKKKP